ncbi:MAG TPA: aminoglycoside phosphotransferase family protein [Candidatus Limnocylindrales bacterium]|nr:aminoglycoside phosphotransferase family protein [Candidatus Limnocylindrales bacterium]
MAPQPSLDPAAIAAAFGLGRPLGEPVPTARGELGRVWRLETTRGRWAIKEPFEPPTEKSALVDFEFQLAALAAGVPMPRPLLARGGRVLAAIEGRSGRVVVRAYTWLDLVAAAPAARAPEAAAILGRIHAIGYPAGGRPIDWFTDPVGEERWNDLLELARRAPVEVSPLVEALLPELAAAEPLLPARHGDRLQRCHLDFNLDNVLLDAAGRLAIVDWENSGPASADQELASALYEVVAEPTGTRAFLDAYEAAGGPGRIRGAESFAMALAVQGHLVQLYARQAFATGSGAGSRERGAWRVRQIAARPLTLAAIDEYLAAR